jgi:hypothetical protein
VGELELLRANSAFCGRTRRCVGELVVLQANFAFCKHLCLAGGLGNFWAAGKFVGELSVLQANLCFCGRTRNTVGEIKILQVKSEANSIARVKSEFSGRTRQFAGKL